MSELGRILIVDDEASVVEVLSEYFVSQGYAAETALSGPEALAVVGRRAADLVLLDVRMPGMDGLEVLRRINATDPTLPVIMVTANEDVALARETLKLGAFDYVAKPFDFVYLDRVVVAGFTHRAGRATPLSGASDEPTDPWKTLATAVFRAVRSMASAARASTGERLEELALEGARASRAGQHGPAGQHLAQLGLLLAVAADVGDLPRADCATIETAIETVRKAVPQLG